MGMKANQSEVQLILSERGVIARRDHPQLLGTLDRLIRRGDLCAVLPGVYASPKVATTFDVRVRAVMAAAPDAILVDGAAAKASFWPELRVSRVTCALPVDKAAQPGFHFSRREIPPELVVQRGRLRMTAPGLTALDLCATLGGEPIDEVLRTRAATLAQLHRAIELTGSRKGNTSRRELLLDSRDQPWSEAERLFHRLLRAAGLTGWRANIEVNVDGWTFYLDVGFRRCRLAVEIDGRRHVTDRKLFEKDRWRQNALVIDGWRVLRFTWRMLVDRPEHVIETVRRALAD